MNNKLPLSIIGQIRQGQIKVGEASTRGRRNREKERGRRRRLTSIPTSVLGSITWILSQISFEIHPALWDCGKLSSIGSGGEVRQSGSDYFVRFACRPERTVMFFPYELQLLVFDCSASVIWRNGLKVIELGVAFWMLESAKLSLLTFNRSVVDVERSLASRMCLG